MAKTHSITAEKLRELFNYDPETGIFTRRIRTAQRNKVGSVADSPSKIGYMRLFIGATLIYSHRAAWCYTYGYWPEKQIDHINGVKSDNRIINLREVDNRLNHQNLKKHRIDNKCGYLGVSQTQSKRWFARIRHHGQVIHLGVFDTPELAHQAYLEAKRKLHEACTI